MLFRSKLSFLFYMFPSHDTGSSDSGDIVIMVDDLTRVGEAYKISKRVLSIAKQGIFVGIGVSVLFMLIAAFGYISPVYGALLQEGLEKYFERC